jgi:hypothetical protein
VEKLLFSVTLHPDGAHPKHCNCTLYLDKKIAAAKLKVLPILYLEASVRMGRGIEHVKGYNSTPLFHRIYAFKKNLSVA